jgi:hypothetical protein
MPIGGERSWSNVLSGTADDDYSCGSKDTPDERHGKIKSRIKDGNERINFLSRCEKRCS